MLSDLTLRELALAPPAVKRLLDPITEDEIEMVSLTEEAAELAREYLRAGVVSTKMRVDAEHIQTYRILFTRALKGVYVWIPEASTRSYLLECLNDPLDKEESESMLDRS